MTRFAAADPELTAFIDRARAWLSGTLARQLDSRDDTGLDVQVFRNLSEAAERSLISEEAQWQQTKAAAGFGLLDWPRELGGQGLDTRFQAAFSVLEREYRAPVGHELVMVTTRLIAPTLRRFAAGSRQIELMRDFMTARQLCCQLFSEPAAGSDLASLATRARPESDGWRVTGQKIWSSGAQFSDWGLLLARTDPDRVKHQGITAFLMPMDAPGIDIRPIKQMSGGSSFAEVYLDDVQIHDELRVGEVGAGWDVALATLGFEREASDGSAGVGGSWEQVRELVERTPEVASDPIVRQQLARLYTRSMLNQLTGTADAARRAEGHDPGAAGSLRKLQWVALMREVSDAVASILGAELTADSGRADTFGWRDHVLGAVGYSIAGGTDEIQRNIIAERILGLPAEPRADKGVPWSRVPR